MRWVCAGVMAALLAGCARSQMKMSSGELIAMKEKGLSEDRILKEAARVDVVLMLTEDDLISLIAAGFSQEAINGLLTSARDFGASGHQH